MSLLVILLLILGLIRIPAIQNKVAKSAASYLSNRLNTPVSVEGFGFTFLDKINLDKVFVADKQNDTLAYIGHLEIKITDWFIFKSEKDLKYIGLKDAYINLQRPKNDSFWNYQFILDAFASKDKKKDKSSNSFDFGFKKVDLKNVRFVYIDKWIGEDYDLNLGIMQIDINKFDQKLKQIIIDKIETDNLVFGIRDYKGGRPLHLRRKRSNIIDTTPFNPDHWKISLNKLALNNARFFMDDPDKPAERYGLFNEWKMNISPIHLLAENIQINNDTLVGKLKHLSAKDRSGIEIKEMHADVKVSPRISECKNLFLKTNNSVVQDYYAMHYDRFPDFIEYIEKVKMEARFNNSTVAINDITFFAPEMELFKDMVVQMKGTGGGTVAKLYANNIEIKDNRSTLNVGNFAMNGLPDIEVTDMSFFNSRLQTNGTHLLHYFPFLAEEKSINIAGLGNLNVPFDLVGSINDFNVKSHIQSEIGNLNVDANLHQMLEPVPTYDGNVVLNNFNVGKFLNTEKVSFAYGNLDFKGASFDPKQINITTKGKIEKLESPQYTFTNIDIDGNYQNQTFDGTIGLNDNNAHLKIVALASNLTTKPKVKLSADILNLKLQPLGWSNENISLKGLLDGQFEGNSIDEILGEATLKQMVVMRDDNKLDIDSLYLKSVYEDDIRYLLLGTNNLSARLWGNYKLIELPNTFTHFLSKYIPKYFKEPKNYDHNQLIYFDMNAENISDLIAVFGNGVKMPEGGVAHGFLNAATDKVSIDSKIPNLIVNGISFDSVFIKGEGNQNAFNLNAGTSQLGSGDNIFLQQMNCIANLENNLLDFNISTAVPGQFGNAVLNGKGEIFEDSLLIKILPSKIFVNNNNWEIPEGNSILFANKKLSIRNLEINSDDQHIVINRKPNTPGAAAIELQNLGIAPLARLLRIDDWISGGRLNGELNILDILDEPTVYFDIQSDSISVQDEPLQSMKFAGRYDQKSQTIYLEPTTGITDKEGSVAINGNWKLNSNAEDAIQTYISFSKAKVSWLSPIVKSYVNQLDGRISGTVAISGSNDNIKTDGKLILQNIAVRPQSLGEKYIIPSAQVQLKNNLIELGTITFEDMQANKGSITGKIRHQNLVDYFFDARIKSDKIRVLNLSASEGERYYGTIDAVVNAVVVGDVTDIKMQASVSPLENSSLIIPLDFSSDIGSYSYIKFKKPLEYYNFWNNRKLKFSNKYNVRIDAEINNNLTTNIILDPKTNDALLSKGDGNIVMEIPSDGDIRLNGNYRIESGKYNFSFRQLQVLNYNEEFDILPGSTIIWSGDLYDAHLNVSGVTKVKTRLYNLISNEVNRLNLSNQELADAQLPQIISVRLNVGNTLQNPELGFKIELTENRSIGTYAYQKLERINTDEKQKLNQVASLLLLGQFAPPEGFLNNSSGAVTSGTLNNVSDIVSSVASSQLTNWANRLFNVEDLNIGVKYKNYNLSNSTGAIGSLDNFSRNEAKFSVRKNFFQNRLLVDVGGVYDWGGQNSYTSNIAGDFLVQYLIRRDGRMRFNIFRTSNYDALIQQNKARQGIGLSYRRSFNNIWELIGIKKEENKEVVSDTPNTTQVVDTMPMTTFKIAE